MSYNDWLKLIKNTGADPRLADQAWLQSQFRSGTSPAMVANAIKINQFPRPQAPMMQVPIQQPIYQQPVQSSMQQPVQQPIYQQPNYQQPMPPQGFQQPMAQPGYQQIPYPGPGYAYRPGMSTGTKVLLAIVGVIGIFFLAILGAGLKGLGQPHLSARWVYNGSEYALLKIKNRSSSTISDIRLWLETDIATTDHGIETVSHGKVYGQDFSRTLRPDQTQTVTFWLGNIPDWASVQGTCSSGDLYITNDY
ncbi:MAG: hypothetical protein JST12_18100 [Armatimonadetes bacterium]|nr:hypothetical protein [Armatimonadota bacterium]